MAGAQHGHATQLPRPLMNDSEVEAASNLGSRKRAREAEDLRTQWQQHHQQLLMNVPDFQQNTGPGSVVNPHSTGVSTGLRLTFEDDRIRSSSPVFTSGRVETSKNVVTSAVDDYSSHLQQERDEIEQLLKIQVLIKNHHMCIASSMLVSDSSTYIPHKIFFVHFTKQSVRSVSCV